GSGWNESGVRMQIRAVINSEQNIAERGFQCPRSYMDLIALVNRPEDTHQPLANALALLARGFVEPSESPSRPPRRTAILRTTIEARLPHLRRVCAANHSVQQFV